MSINKNIKKSLILTLGLVIGGLYTSTHDIYAAEKEVVRAERLNVRKGPSIEESKIKSLEEGTVVEILERSNGWNKVKVSENEGWISADYTSKEKGKVTANKLNVRKGPSIEESKIDELKNNQDIEILEDQDNWYKVELENKKTGWISGDYILTETEEKIEKEKAEKENSAAQETTNKNNNTVVSTTNNNTNVENQNNNTEDKNTTSSNNNSKTTMTVNASAYSGHTITATGTTPKWGTIAVDPSVIPYGTKVYIPKFDMVFIAEDCGGAIKGNKIDIFMNSEADCNEFGRQNIEIQILN